MIYLLLASNGKKGIVREHKNLWPYFTSYSILKCFGAKPFHSNTSKAGIKYLSGTLFFEQVFAVNSQEMLKYHL